VKMTVSGPENHPLSRVTVKWRDDGSLTFFVSPGPIEVRDMNLRNRRVAMVRVGKGATR
jgi:hypothetical protein